MDSLYELWRSRLQDLLPLTPCRGCQRICLIHVQTPFMSLVW